MPTFTGRWFRENEHVPRWEKAEKAGKIGSVADKWLALWRSLKVKHPTMIEMFVVGSEAVPTRFKKE